MAGEDWTAIEWARRARSREVDYLVGPVIFDPVSLALSVIAAITLGTSRALRRAPHINSARQMLLIAGRRVRFADIDRAKLVVDGRGASRELWLWFGTSGTYLEARLRDGGTLQLDAASRDALIGILEKSSVEIPKDRYDPKGRFARSTFPSNVTKAEALDLVRSPPMPGDPLPIIEP